MTVLVVQWIARCPFVWKHYIFEREYESILSPRGVKKKSPLLWLYKEWRVSTKNEMGWDFIGVHITNRTLPGPLDIGNLTSLCWKIFRSFAAFAAFAATAAAVLEEKLGIWALCPCNILYFCLRHRASELRTGKYSTRKIQTKLHASQSGIFQLQYPTSNCINDVCSHFFVVVSANSQMAWRYEFFLQIFRRTCL